MPVTSAPALPANIFDNDDDGWQDMPVVREDYLATDLDEEDRKKYHYKAPSADTKSTATSNAIGNLIDFDDRGYEWRSKAEMNEAEYTRLRMKEDEETDEVALRTKYLFDEDAAMTPLSQMQATKKLLTESQRIAYVGLCALTAKEMSRALHLHKRKELKGAVANMELWVLKIMGRLYYHMELETQEQKMIENLAEHGVQAMDLVPSLMTTHTVANPEYDPEEARKRNEHSAATEPDNPDFDEADDISVQTLVAPAPPPKPASPTQSTVSSAPASQTSFNATNTASNPTQTTTRVLGDTTTHMTGVTTSLSSADENVTLDIRWTVLCDLFLILIADSVYDARSRVLLESIALKLGLGWLDVVRFESRVTEALEIQEDIEKLEQKEIMDGVQKAGRKRRYMILGLATLGGGLVLGLSAGLLAPVIGVGLAGAFSAIGITGTGAFLGGTAGAAAITTGGVLTGSAIAGRGMARRTRNVRTFDILPLHNNKRVNCILTVPGFMTSINDDVRLPFSVLDSIVGDVFSVLWEPDMIRETGSALQIMTAEVLSQVGITILGATAMTALMSALQWPIILTKLGYLIDNPWSNALDRAKAAGLVLADVLQQRHLGVRPITLIGFSLGARVIFYALLELSRQKAYGIVQDVFLLGATLTVSQSTWCQTRAVVSGRYVNAFAKNDWVLNYLFRATSGGIGTVAGLRPVLNVPGLENVDVTDKISGHMSYRTFMPLILDQLGFPVSALYFDEPAEDIDIFATPEVDKHEETGWFKRKKKTGSMDPSQTPTASSNTKQNGTTAAATSAATAGGAAGVATSVTSPADDDDNDLPPRMPSSSTHLPRTSSDIASGSSVTPPSTSARNSISETGASTPSDDATVAHIPKHAGFDLEAMKKIIGEAHEKPSELQVPSRTNHVGHSSPVQRSTIPTTPKPLPKPIRSETEEYQKESGFVPMSPSELLAKERKNATVGLDKSFAESVSLEEEQRSPRVTASPEMKSQSSPTLTFGSAYDTPAWASSSTNVTPMAIRPERRESYGFGYNGYNGYKESFASPSTSSSMTQNPFTMSSNHSTLSMNDYGYSSGGFGGNNSYGMDTGLSFGTADGTIVNGGATYGGGSTDSWSVPGFDAKKPSSSTSANGFSSNPWS